MTIRFALPLPFSTRPELATGGRMDVLAAFMLVILTLGSFGRVAGYDFVNVDDPGYVLENANVRAGLTAPSVVRDFTESHAGLWIPLTWLSLQLDYQLFGLNAGGYHLTNLLLHAANAVLLFGVLRRMTGQARPSFFVAALFAVHPLHVESIAWVTERKDVLSTLFWLLTMWAYVRYTEAPGLARYLAVITVFTLGLMAKPMLVTLPLVLLLIDFWPLRRFPDYQKMGTGSFLPLPARLVQEKLLLVVLSAACCIITMTVQSRGGVLLSFEKIPLELRLWHAFTAWMHYLGKAFWPTHLAVFYPHPRTAVPVAQGALAGVALVFLTGLFLWVGRRRPFLPVGWLWFVVTLLPVIGIVQSGPQAWADRFTYVPLIGLFIMAAWLLEEVLPFVSGAGVMLVQTVILSGCIALSWTQTASWRDSETLWKHALRVTDENYPAHWNLGAFLNRSGRKDEALFHFQQCLRLMDDVPARMEVARLLLEQGQLEEARTHYLQVLQWEPAYAVARNNLGQIYFLQGKTDLAIEELEKTVQLHPAFAAAHDNLGMVLGARGRWPDAAAHFEQAVRLAPASARFAEHLAEARQRQGGR